MRLGTISEILGLSSPDTEKLEKAIVGDDVSPHVLGQLGEENDALIGRALKDLGAERAGADEAREALFAKIEKDEEELYSFLGITRQSFNFQKVADLAWSISSSRDGFFLKKEYAGEILRLHPPEATMKYLNYDKVEGLLKKEDIMEVFSALRFLETDAWMHETFRMAYADFTPDNFESRPIEIRVMGVKWAEIAKSYVEKKHHNVSHLKEFGVIFINPIAQTEAGKFLRDFALLLHYFHEIVFYSKLFLRYSKDPDFNQRFTSLLRGDVGKGDGIVDGEWLIIQRYLWKEDPKDERLFLPHVNPEALHWSMAEKDLAAFGAKHKAPAFDFWDGLDAVGGYFLNAAGGREFVSFDLEDNAMSFVASNDNQGGYFSYHQQEALWNKIFASLVGGYEKLEEYIIENMDKGYIRINKK